MKNEETWEEALQSLIQKGLIEVKGQTVDGKPTYGVTELGRIIGVVEVEKTNVSKKVH